MVAPRSRAPLSRADRRPPKHARLLDRIGYLALRGALGVGAVLPEGITYRVVGGLGGLFVRLSKRRRRYALHLLRNALPHEPDERILLRFARHGTGNLLKVILDMARLSRMVRTGRFADRIDMSELLAAGLPGPWIGVTGHLGSWECGAAGIASGGRETHVMAKLMRNPLAQDWLLRSRRAAGLTVHDRRGGLRSFTRALGRGCVALQVVDQNQRMRGVFAPFFGELASSERAAATLAVRKHYRVVVAAAVRVGVGFRFKFVVQDILDPPRTGHLVQDVETLVTRINQALEKLILRYPNQYLWIHNRYRTRPRLPAAEPVPVHVPRLPRAAGPNDN